MKIIHTIPSGNFSLLPITGNFLTKVDGQYLWNKPNDSWRIVCDGRTRTMFTNIRKDDTEHSPDLWLYTCLTTSYTDTTVKEIMDSSRHSLPKREWYVRQLVEKDCVGIRMFSGLPLDVFWELWRKPVSIEELEIYYPSSQGSHRHYMAPLTDEELDSYRMIYQRTIMACVFKWEELRRDCEFSNMFSIEGQDKICQSEFILPWIKNNCNQGYIPFSDYESMFADDMDDFAYSADIPGLKKLIDMRNELV
jgi:hypothetical protein